VKLKEVIKDSRMTTQILKSHGKEKKMIAEPQSPVCMKLDPLSVDWVCRNGFYFPVSVPAGENPIWSQERFFSAWDRTRNQPPSSSELYASWVESAKDLAEKKYHCGNSKEWEAIEKASQQRNA